MPSAGPDRYEYGVYHRFLETPEEPDKLVTADETAINGIMRGLDLDSAERVNF